MSSTGNSGPYARAVLLWRKAGWLGTLPVVGKGHDKDNGPVPAGFTGNHGRWPSLDNITHWINIRGNNNIVLRLPENVIGIDVDAYHDGTHQRVGADTIASWETELGSLPSTYVLSSRDRSSGSGIYLYQVPAGIDWVSDLGSSSDVQIIRYGHRYAVTWPSIHPNGSLYKVYGPDGSIVADDSLPEALITLPRPDDLPEFPGPWVRALTKRDASLPELSASASAARVASYTGTSAAGARTDATGATSPGKPITSANPATVDPELMLVLGAPPGEQNQKLFEYLCRLQAKKLHVQEIRMLGYIAISQMVNYDPSDPWTTDHVDKMVERVVKTYKPGTSIEQRYGIVSDAERDFARKVLNATPETPSRDTNPDSDNALPDPDNSLANTGSHPVSADSSPVAESGSFHDDTDVRLPDAPETRALPLGDLPRTRLDPSNYPLTATLTGPLIGGAYASIASEEDATEAGNAQRFARIYKDTFRYVPEWKQWIYINDKGRWKRDTDDRALHATLAVTEDIRATDAADSNQNQIQREQFRQWMQRSRNTRPRKDLLRAASSLPSLIISEKELDTNPFLIGHEDNTVIELLTYVDNDTHNAWRLRPVAPEDNITMSINYKFDPSAVSKIWDNFIRFVLPEYEVRSYAQTAEGYCLQAHNPKRKWLVIYGQTTTGKTTFTETISKALGDYCKSSSHSIFNEIRGAKPRPDILNIFKARRAMISETSTHITLEASSIKRMTGNTSISVRGNFSNTYTDAIPDCTIVLDCNDFPTIIGIDGPTRDRTLVIPFKHQMLNIKDKNKSERMFRYVTYLQSLGDPDSAQDALQSFNDEEKETRTQTLSAVLHWLLDGWTYAVMGRLDNLENNMPAEIRQETMDAHSKMLLLTDYIEDMCIVDSESFEPISRLFIAYQIWMRKNGITKGDPAFLNSNTFARALTDAKFLAEKRTVTMLPSGESKQVRVRLGIRLTDAMRKDIMFHESAMGVGDI